MCEICRQTPCHNMCPNYVDTRQVIGTCSVCGQEILTGDGIYQITENEAIHEKCVQGFTPEEVFSLLDIEPSQTFRNSDIDGDTFLEFFGIRKEEAH